MNPTVTGHPSQYATRDQLTARAVACDQLADEALARRDPTARGLAIAQAEAWRVQAQHHRPLPGHVLAAATEMNRRAADRRVVEPDEDPARGWRAIAVGLAVSAAFWAPLVAWAVSR